MQDKAKVEELLKELKEQATTEIEVALINEFEQQIKKLSAKFGVTLKDTKGTIKSAITGASKASKAESREFSVLAKIPKVIPKQLSPKMANRRLT